MKKSKLGVTVDNSETLMKTDSAKTSSSKLTCATVERWTGEDLADFQAELWLTYNRKKTVKANYCSALKCHVCTQFEPMKTCPARFSKCNKCLKIGHWVQACKSSKPGKVFEVA